MSDTHQDLISLTADIVSAHVANNSVATPDIGSLIRNVYDALSTAGAPPTAEAPKQEPAVPVRSSIKRDYIVCLEDGQKLQMLKRYLRTNFSMTPEEYRAKWNLPYDYPMVAPAYAEKRAALAKQSGLGRKRAGVTKTVKSASGKAVKSISAGLEAARAHLGGEPAKAPAKTGRKAKATQVAAEG